MIVIDSNVFIKLFKKEADYETAKEFLNYVLTHNIPLYAPDLFKYEVIGIAQKFGFEIPKIQTLITSYENSILSIEAPISKVWQSAISMIQEGHPKSGYPSIYDSVYHCFTLEKGFLFITADDRHIKKTKKFGGIVLLRDWKIILENKKL